MAYTYGPGGARTALNITAPTVVKALPGLVFTLTVITSPSVAGGIYDSASTSGLSASNEVAVIGTTSTIISLGGWPCANGITINPGTGGVVAVSYQ